jgi:hypothetical protein
MACASVVHRGPPLGVVRAATCGGRRLVPHRARTFRDISHRDGAFTRRRQAAAVCRERVPRVPDVRRAGERLCAIPLCRVRAGSPLAAFLQGPRVLSELRGPPHDRARCTPGGRGLSERGALHGASPGVCPNAADWTRPLWVLRWPPRLSAQSALICAVQLRAAAPWSSASFSKTTRARSLGLIGSIPLTRKGH